jgi:hypothetical protein
MANKDLFKQAIAEAKSVREAAIANAKSALEESLTPHLKDMLAAKLESMEDSSTEEVVLESTEEIEEAPKKDDKDDAIDENDGLTAVKEAEHDDEAEDDSEESDDDAAIETPEDDADSDMDAEIEGEEEIDGDEDLSKLSVDQFKEMIRDVISQEVGGDAAADDMDAGDIEGMGDEAPMEDPALDAEPEMGAEEDEIDLDELIRELDSMTDEVTEGEDKEEGTMEEAAEGAAANEIPAESDTKEKNINDTLKESDMKEALETINTLRKELSEVNILNAKLLYVNKIFKANNLSESQKVNVIAAFDKAETVKEVKLVFETVVDNVGTKKVNTVKEHKGSASKATGTTASNPGVIAEASEAVRRMQKLAGII